MYVYIIHTHVCIYIYICKAHTNVYIGIICTFMLCKRPVQEKEIWYLEIWAFHQTK